MKAISMKAYAKINWTLDITGKREDGYHHVEMILQSIGIHDRIFLRETYGEVRLLTDSPLIPTGAENIACRAASLLKERFGIKSGVEIFIEKNIPVEAGLAGGSADAAAVLVGLNKLWDLGIEEETLSIIGAALGADVPFCVTGGTAIARGIGEVLEFFTPAHGIWLIVIKPLFGVSTGEVYRRLRWDNIKYRPNTQAMVEYLRKGDITNIGPSLGNVLEEVTLSMHPEIIGLKEALLEAGALGSLMSGSGPSVYGVFRDKQGAEAAYKLLKGRYQQVFLTQSSAKGVEITGEDWHG